METSNSIINQEIKNSKGLWHGFKKIFATTTEKYPYEKELKIPVHKILNNLGTLKELTSAFSAENTNQKNIEIANQVNKLSSEVSTYAKNVAEILVNIEKKEKKYDVVNKNINIEKKMVTTNQVISLLREIGAIFNHIEKSCDAKSMKTLLENSTDKKIAFTTLTTDLSEKVENIYKALETFL